MQAVAQSGVSLSPTIPGRIQWTEAGGYCGETSAQMLALLNGAWVSQAAWRSAGGGELLLGVNLEGALTKMKLTYTAWNYRAAQPQYPSFAVGWGGSRVARQQKSAVPAALPSPTHLLLE